MSDESEKSDLEDQCHKDPDTDESDQDYTEATWEAPPMSQSMMKKMHLSQVTKGETSNINADFVSSLSRFSRSSPPVPPKSFKAQVDPVKHETSPVIEEDAMEVENYRNEKSPESDQRGISVKDRAKMFEQPQNIQNKIALKQTTTDSENVQLSIPETSQTENSSDIYSSTKEIQIRSQPLTEKQKSTSDIEESSDLTMLKQSHSDQNLINKSQMEEGKDNILQNEEQVKKSSKINSSTESQPLNKQQKSPPEESSDQTQLKQSHSEQTFTNQTQMEEGTDNVLQNQEQARNYQFQNQHPIKQQYPGPRSVHGWPGTPPAPQMRYAHPGYRGQPHVQNPRYDQPYQRTPAELQYPSMGQHEMWQGHQPPHGQQFWQPPPQQFGQPLPHQFRQAPPQQFGQHPHQFEQPPQHFGPLPPQQFGQLPHQPFQQPQQFGQTPHQQFQQPPSQQFGRTPPHGLSSGQGLQNTKMGETSPNEPSGKPRTKPGTNPPKSSQSSKPQGGKIGGKDQTSQKKPGDGKKETLKPGKDRRSDADTGAKGKSQKTKGPEKMFVCVDGIDNDESNDTVFNYLESRSKVDVIVEESLRTTENPEHAVVVFENTVDLESLKRACDSRKLKNSRMTFDKLEPPRTVIVSSEDDGLTEKKLQDHLQKKKIETVRVHTTDEGEISVKLKNTEGVIEILKSTNMKIDGSKIVISVTYSCDHGTYWDHSLHRVAIPAPYKPAHVDEHVKGFLIDITSTCNEHLEQHHACLTISDEIHIKCTIDPKDKEARRKVKVWKDSVEKAWNKFISSNVQKRELKVTSDTKDLLKEHINTTKEEHKSEELKVIYEDDIMTIIFVGKSNIVENFHEKVSAKKTEIQENLNRKNKMKTDSMNLKPIEIALMLKCNKFEQLSQIASDFTFKVDEENGTITLNGVQEDIDKAKVAIFEAKSSYHTWTVTSMSVWQCRLLGNQTVNETVYEKLEDNNISAIFKIDQSKIEVCTTSEKHCKQVDKVLKEAILDEDIKLDETSKNVLMLDEWAQKKASIKNLYPDVVHIEDSADDKIVLTAWSTVITDIVNELNEFIVEHSVYESDVKVSNEAELKFLEMHCKDDIKDLQYNNQNLTIEFHKQSVKVKGTKVATKKARDEINHLISQIKKDQYTISKPGVDSLLDDQTKCDSLITPIEEESRTVILVDKNTFPKTPHHRNTAHQESDEDYVRKQVGNSYKRGDTKKHRKGGHALKSGPVKYTNGTKVILVKKEDLGKQQADVIVCSTNGELNLSGPAGKSLVSVAGQQILDEIKTSYKDGIKHGDIAAVSGYNLQCQEVYLAALPGWSAGGDKIISKCVNNCLTAAEQSQHSSIVFPALGTGNLNYPRDLVAETMYRCVEDFDQNNTSLKEVKFLCYDNDTIKAFENEEAKIMNPGFQPPVAAAAYNPGYNPTHYKKHNITVKIVKGDLGKQKVDSMVSAVPTNLNLEGAGGAGMSLLQGLGPSVQMDIAAQHPSGVTSGALAAVKLSNPAGSCKAVYLTSLEPWDKEKNVIKESDKQIYKFVYSCLERAEKDGYKSIGIPAMGTGKIGYPHDLVAKYMYDVVEKFADSNKNSKVTDVKFVVHHKDPKSIQAFFDEEKKRVPKPAHVPKTATHGFAAADTSTHTAVTVKIINDKEFQVGAIKLSVEQGDILAKSCDAIVNGSNEDLDFTKGAVSQAIRSKCDAKKLDAECAKKKAEMKQKHIVRTSACGLPATKHIIHVNPRNNLKDWKKIIIKALYKAENKQLSSLALPALGTGIGGGDQEGMGRTIMESLVEFVEEGKTSHLKNVYLVIFKQEMVQPMLKGVRSGGQSSTSSAGVQKQVIRTKNTQVSSVAFTIYSMAPHDRDKAKKQLDKAVADKYKTEHVRESLISELRSKELEYLQSVEDKYPIKLEIDMLRSEITIEGTTDHTMNAKQDIFDWFRKFRHTRHCEAEAEIVKEQAQWFLKDKDPMTGAMDLLPYPPMINMHLENAHKGDSKRTDVDFKDDQGEEYIIDLKTMTEYPKKNPNDKVDVIRREKLEGTGGSFEPPPEWIEQGTENVKVVNLINTDPEYQSVEKKLIDSVKNGKFAKTSPDVIGKTVVVSKIERIQNLNLFRMYAAKRALMVKQNTNVQNEKELWHGTPESAVVSINLYGFNRSYCTANSQDAWWGQGVYFATDASYSVRDFLTRPTQSSVAQERNIYLCLVLTGVSRKGTKHEPLRVLPTRTDGTMLPYDSNTDDLNPPLEYVVFNDTQAYPLYRIKFQLK